MLISIVSPEFSNRILLMPKHFLLIVTIFASCAGCIPLVGKNVNNDKEKCIQEIVDKANIEGTIKFFRTSLVYSDLCPQYPFRFRGKNDTSLDKYSDYVKRNFNFRDFLIFRAKMYEVSWEGDYLLIGDVQIIESFSSDKKL